MFPMTMTISNATQLSAILAALNVDQIVEVKPEAKATPKKEAKAEEKKPEAAKPEVARTQTTAEAPDAPDQKAENSVAAPALKYDDVAKAVLAVSQKHGRDAAIGVLKQFGLETLKAAKPEQFADIKAAANKAL